MIFYLIAPSLLNFKGRTKLSEPAEYVKIKYLSEV